MEGSEGEDEGGEDGEARFDDRSGVEVRLEPGTAVAPNDSLAGWAL